MESKKPSKKTKGAPGSKLTSEDLEKYKQLLQEIRVKIAGDLKHLEGDALNQSQRDSAGDLSGYSFHIADMATDNFDREFNLGLASNEQRSLNLIDAALRKLEHGAYGICEYCPKPIPKKRLTAMPHAPLCIKCQEIEEKEKRPQ
ncbi:MAG: TraR/DksA C4-type zinc finger protein [Candidatus Omnitrophota bacterium]|nr:TraR/DksA C4-type zinc finger protein [Candidatus Omnitrophota bacterium]